MKLPNCEIAVISETKIKDYLLSLEHPVGREKARFFRGLGFSTDRWENFVNALRQIAERSDVSEVQRTEYGVRYIIDGILSTPNG